jgi:hypothetical protein
MQRSLWGLKAKNHRGLQAIAEVKIYPSIPKMQSYNSGTRNDNNDI